MLLATIVLWALNLTVTPYILTHGFQPLAYASVRYGLAALVFASLTLVARALAPGRSPRPRCSSLAAALGALRQPDRASSTRSDDPASVIALILGATPIFAALIAGSCSAPNGSPGGSGPGRSLSFAGVALVALGPAASSRASLGGVLLGMLDRGDLGRVLGARSRR